MANTLLTIGGITAKCLEIFQNSNAFLQRINRQYDASFAVSGYKIGSSLNVRLTNDVTVGLGATVTPQSVTEKAITINVATQRNVALTFGSAELALSMDDFSSRFLEQSVNKLAGYVAADIMQVAEGVPNIVHNVDGGNNTISPTAATWALAGAILNQNSCPEGDRTALLDVLTSARTVTSMSGLFNPQQSISEQYRAGNMGASRNTLGIAEWCNDQTIIKHQTAAFGTLGTFQAISANGLVMTTSALNGPLNAGDIFTVANVDSANRVTNQSNGTLMQFVVTAAVAAGATSVPIYPALIPPVGGNPVAFQTVNVVPTVGAALNSPINAGEIYRKNLVFDPLAFTMVTADLYLPTAGIVAGSRKVHDGVSLRMITDFVTLSDQRITRLDILYGYALIRPEWACIVADAL